jgi:Skp family chaperone for outer membrane proteins
MKKLLCLAAVGVAFASLGYVGTWVAAQDGVRQAGAAEGARPTLKIGIVNITKVIKDFKKANAMGDRILADAQRYDNELKNDQEALKAQELKIRTMPEGPEKDAAAKMLRQKQMELQDKDLNYQKDIRKRRDDMAVEINKDIARIIDSLARHLGLEMVLTCPDVADENERGSLSDAMRRMTAPATWIAWRHPALDITDEVSRWLDHYCKPPAGVTPASAPNK